MNNPLVRFFSGIDNPLLVSDLITTLKKGNIVSVERVPTPLLPALVLLSTVALRSYEVAIVDDYAELLDRLRLTYKEPTPGHWHPEGYLAAFVTDNGINGDYVLPDCPDATYLFSVFKVLIEPHFEKRRTKR